RTDEYGHTTCLETSGASEDTAIANGLRVRGTEASNILAAKDLKKMKKFKDDITSVGQRLGVEPALIAAIISRQSQAGTNLSTSGYGVSDPNCFGLMQINKHYHAVKGNAYSSEHIDQGVTFLIQLIKTMRRTRPDWSKEQQLKGALACYVAGEERVLALSYEDLDSVTPSKDFSSDVVARAHWFAQNGF
uniref:Lysozyme g n=1 Tax=Tetraodon nigroviridis TaxID=99883 RepID=H3CFI4_TETNG